MIEQGGGSGRVRVVLAGVTLLAGLGGCATDSAFADAAVVDPGSTEMAATEMAGTRGEGSMLEGSARAAVERSNGAPEQMVLHMVGDPANVRPDAPSTRRLSATEGTGASLAQGSRARTGEPITSRHLEAELNRLEAELGR